MVSGADFDEMRANLASLSKRVDVLEANQMPKSSGKKKRKRGSSSTKPKKQKPGVANAYMFWLNQMGIRDAIKFDCTQQNPDASMTDVARKAGERWRNMSKDEKAEIDAKWKAFNEGAERLDANARNHWITELGMGKKFREQLTQKNPDVGADDIEQATLSAWESLPKAAKQVVQKQYKDFKDLKESGGAERL